jgi:hypothetical protein
MPDELSLAADDEDHGTRAPGLRNGVLFCHHFLPAGPALNPVRLPDPIAGGRDRACQAAAI